MHLRSICVCSLHKMDTALLFFYDANKLWENHSGQILNFVVRLEAKVSVQMHTTPAAGIQGASGPPLRLSNVAFVQVTLPFHRCFSNVVSFRDIQSSTGNVLLGT